MSDNQSWESKRDEVWKRIVELEGSVKTLATGLSSVKTLAESRVSADEKTANDAAKKAVDGAKKVKEAVDVVAGMAANIEQLKKSLPEALQKVGQVEAMYQDGKRDQEIGNKIAKELNALQDSLKNILEIAKKQGDEVSAKVQVVDQQAQSAKELKTQVSNDAAEVKACLEKSNTLRSELQAGKKEFDKVLAEAQENLTSLHDAKKDELDAVVKEKSEVLDALKEEKATALDDAIAKYTKEHDGLLAEKKQAFAELLEKANASFGELKDRIETLLPGATSAGLASAFRLRKDTIQGTKRWWIFGLILSSVALIIFGVCSLLGCLPNQSVVVSVAGRSVIVVGLIFIEEFCRRNYNIAARLTEAYAYKEVLSTSYLGYKKEMNEMPMPKNTEESPETKGSSVLMQTLLKKLDEEPGCDVFDKERQVVGVGSLIDAVGKQNDDAKKQVAEAQGMINAQFASSKLSAKVTWPVVVFAGVLVVAISVILCFFITYGAIGGTRCLSGADNPTFEGRTVEKMDAQILVEPITTNAIPKVQKKSQKVMSQ